MIMSIIEHGAGRGSGEVKENFSDHTNLGPFFEGILEKVVVGENQFSASIC